MRFKTAALVLAGLALLFTPERRQTGHAVVSLEVQAQFLAELEQLAGHDVVRANRAAHLDLALALRAVRQRLPRLQPLSGDFGQAQDVAQAVLYLASDESAFVTGSVLTVDGGWTVR